MVKKAFARMSMLTKLKYAGVPRDDLLDVYKLFIRSLMEYCAVVWHSRLTLEQSDKLERVQKISLKVILGEDYDSYDAALKLCNLETLFDRRGERCMSFAKRCIKHPVNKRLFPLNRDKHDLHDETRERFTVNFARGEALKTSTIPYLQRMLNSDHTQSKK
jgi:hypothetical protein